jgi:hypothetical protein
LFTYCVANCKYGRWFTDGIAHKTNINSNLLYTGSFTLHHDWTNLFCFPVKNPISNHFQNSSSAGAMGEAKSKNLIHVYHHSTAITSASAGTFWVAHELGHAFNYALVPNQTEPNYNHGQGVIDLAQKGVRANGALISGATSSTSWLGNYTRGNFEGYQSSSPPHIQNPRATASEDFADMFSNYVHNSFAVGNAGQARYDFMANHMSSWIALAVSNNE